MQVFHNYLNILSGLNLCFNESYLPKHLAIAVSDPPTVIQSLGTSQTEINNARISVLKRTHSLMVSTKNIPLGLL